jgi:tRNA(adenine34) deaminase
MQATAANQSPCLNRRHLVAGALGAIALQTAIPAFARGIEAPATKEDVAFMRIALEEAALGDYPFGAVIARNGEVLARGRNLGIQEQDPTAHGEMVAQGAAEAWRLHFARRFANHPNG